VIREGMIVRTPDGEKLGKVASVGAEDFTIERGLVFKHRFVAPLEHVILVDDEKDEMFFGSPETADELENRVEEDELATELLEDPHLHRA
jgi:hypothetical protein